MNDDDRVFKALADPSRRRMLDLLFAHDGRTLAELDEHFEMSRFGVMKHVRVLADAGLVLTRKDGRSTRHFLNPVPIQLVADRWVDKYRAGRATALVDLKIALETTAATTPATTPDTTPDTATVVDTTPKESP